MIEKDVFPKPGGINDTSLRPGLGGGEMAPLAAGRAANACFCRSDRPGHHGVVAAKTVKREQGCDGAVPQAETGIPLGCLAEVATGSPFQA